MKLSSAALVVLAWLVGCADPLATPAVEADPSAVARSGVLLSLTSSLEVGDTAAYVVTGALPGEKIQLLRGSKLGAGPCPPKLGGVCLDVTGTVKSLGSAVADARGVATFSFVVPAVKPGANLATQAVIVRPAGSVKSQARLDAISAPIARTQPTSGSAVAVTEDGAVAVTANRSAGEITVLDVATGAQLAKFDVGGEEPWVAVVSGDQAWVLLRASRQVARISGLLAGAPVLDLERADVDAEPSGIAISPSGTSLYVTNHNAGTVSVVDAASLAVVATVDLNAALVDTGLLGPSVAAARPGLARPYAVVVTDDGDDDDDDETVYVTEFFSQDDPAKSHALLGSAYFDLGRQGLVYAFGTATLLLQPAISLGAVDDVGFADSLGQATGCFPNQLANAALDNGRLYVTGMCASPRAPTGGGGVNAKTKVHPTLFVVDTATGVEIAAERIVLTRALEDHYITVGTPDDAARRFPLLPSALVFDANHVAFLAAEGADAVFRVELAADGSLLGFGATPYIDTKGAWPMGQVPIGLALTAPDRALVLHDNTRNLSTLDLAAGVQLTAVESATAIDRADLDAINLNRGRLAFVTGLDRWSLEGQAWGACGSCHPDGRSDGVTWFFETGPRQTPSLEGVIGPNGEHRLLTWTARFDEVSDEEHNTRDFSGGAGATVWTAVVPATDAMQIRYDGTIEVGRPSTSESQVDLYGSMDALVGVGVPGVNAAGVDTNIKSASLEWQYVDDFVASLRAPSPPALDAADVAAGEALFLDHGCNGCHGLGSFTISERFYTPGALANGAGGLLDTTTYSLGSMDPALNPAAAAGPVALRDPGHILCALRDVGTFPPVGTVGAAAPGVTVAEVREDMATPADGSLGFNVPSLVGVGASAPYLHAGNARTLEELLDAPFAGHHQAFSPGFAPSATDRALLVTYLLSIGDDTPTHDAAVPGSDTLLCPATL